MGAPPAIWSRHPERAKDLAQNAGLELGTAEFEELISFPGLEAVHVATALVKHLLFAVAAARRGLHVLCEKPLGDNLAEARQIVRVIKEARVVGSVGYELRLKETRHSADRASPGRARAPTHGVVLPRAVRPRRPLDPSTHLVHDATLGGGRLQGNGVHDLDMLLDVLPPIEAVAAHTEVGVKVRTAGDNEVLPVTAEDAYGILLRFRGGGLGVVSLVATARHSRGDVIEFHGDQGTVRLAVRIAAVEHRWVCPEPMTVLP